MSSHISRRFLPVFNIPHPLYLAYDLSSELINKVKWNKGNTDDFRPMRHLLDLFILAGKSNGSKDLNTEAFQHKTVVIYASINHRAALQTLLKDNTDLSFVHINDELFQPSDRQIGLSGLKYFLFVYLTYLFSRGYSKTSLKCFFMEYLKVYAYYDLFKKVFAKTHTVKNILLLNDHYRVLRACNFAARKKDIKTIYMQHASVSERFPPLSFDYALLDGRHALQTYAGIGKTNTTCFLVGIPKFDFLKDQQRQVNNSGQIKIGIAVNSKSDLPRVGALIKTLSSNPKYTIVVRPHPAQDPKIFDRFDSPFQLSNSKQETSLAFLSKLNILVSGDSNIILEAALMKVKSFYFPLSDALYDYYGFYKHGVVEEVFKDDSLLLKAIQTYLKQPDDRYFEATEYYCQTAGGRYQWQSTELIKEVLLAIESGNMDLPEWSSIQTAENIEAYYKH